METFSFIENSLTENIFFYINSVLLSA